MIALLCATASLILSVVVTILTMPNRRKHSSSKQSVATVEFNPTAYLERIETTFCEFLEAESSEPYVLILWWGLDGLRLNKDGTTEWISRKKPESISHSHAGRFCTIPKSVFDAVSKQSGCLLDMNVDIDNCQRREVLPYYLQLNQNMPLLYSTGCENTISQLSRQNTIANTCQVSALNRQRIQNLEMNISSLQLAAWQAEQNRNFMSIYRCI